MDFSLIETMRWEPEEGFVRLRRHLDRLAASAAALGFAQPVDALQALEHHVENALSPQRVRLELFHDGRIEVTSAPFVPLPEYTVWRIAIAQTRLSSSDPLLRHKTSRRQHYAAACAEYSAERADEVILQNENGEICEGTITSLFVDRGDGVLLTPALECGLLAGVLRGELLERKKAREARLTLADLAGKSLYVGNSLRGLIRAELV